MIQAPFDRRLLRQRQARAAALAVEGADFLVERAAGDLADRLATLVRRFPVALDLGTSTPAFARTLAASGKAEHVLRCGVGTAALDVVADEEALPFAPASLDLVVSGLALHTVNDLPGTLVQLRRALKPDGLLIAAMLGGETLKELREAFAIAESEIDGGISPRVAPFADVRDMGGLLQRAGFALPVTDVETVTVRYADPIRLMADLRAMGATNIVAERRRTPLRRATLGRLVEVYRDRFADPDGRVRATFQIIWLSGWVPHESQQKPLKPGSARARLADALGAREESAGEKAG